MKPEPFVIIRHDVDSEPEYAPKMVKLENESGISSYYFGVLMGLFRTDIIKVTDSSARAIVTKGVLQHTMVAAFRQQ